MLAINDEPEKFKFVHTYGVGLHSQEAHYDIHDPKWQKRQIDDFVEFAVFAEELGFDGLTVTEHHTPQMTCPSPHLLLAAAAVRTSHIRLGTAVTVLPLHHPIRVAEEAGMLDLLSGGRFELGLGRGAKEAPYAIGRDLTPDEQQKGWLESVELVRLALTERGVTFDGEFFKVPRPITIATSPLQDPLPIWIGAGSPETTKLAGQYGWNFMRNSGSSAEHREALCLYMKTADEHGFLRSGANMMVQRFIAIGETEAEAHRNLKRLTSLFSGGPSLFTAGTSEQVIDKLQQLIDDTGARRLLVETFSTAEARLLAEEVLPELRNRNIFSPGPNQGSVG